MYKRPLWLLLITVNLAACSSGIEETVSSAANDDNIASQTISGSVKGAFGAAKTPLFDLNITSDEIPKHLQTVSGNPYMLPSPLQCKTVKNEINDLDTLLGNDMNPAVATGEEDTNYVQEGVNMLQSTAVSFVANKVDIIPFRGVVRKITGADKQAKRYARAYESGKLRRAYLKGLSSALKCDAPVRLAKTKKPTETLAKKDSTSL